MNIDKKQYKKYASAHAPKSPILKNCILAFVFGGGICVLGEFFIKLYSTVGNMVFSDASSLSSITLILISVTLTAIGVFDKIAKVAGAGTLVPLRDLQTRLHLPLLTAIPRGLCLE